MTKCYRAALQEHEELSSSWRRQMNRFKRDMKEWQEVVIGSSGNALPDENML